ncbi:antibiotic biosynthesis monooxygenase [Frankia sp. Ag45/Mut15]|uniref:Antibiotic biosynthesis monooxygenase n=1 Tax=Frankia umida TaxID=573489 RepID=A0ABT0K1T0_9ACTN|nr:antibiotic biosynthesis monooxygenase [Frankia umida]MCK9877738.1 antibiotic biosynthesis monooxygenase [Frankia umida]
MILEYIRYRIPEHRAGEFEEAYKQASKSLEESPECLDFELSRGVESPESYILRIRWESLESHLNGFRKSALFQPFIAQVGQYIESIEEMRHYAPTEVVGVAAGTPRPPTLYEWAGGQDAFERLFARFYETVAEDELLIPLFAGMNPAHAHHVAMWVGEVFGGPAAYTDLRGGYEKMLAHHLGRAITEQQRRRWINLLVDAADHVGLPDDPEFRAAFMSYLEWGTRLAVANSQPDATPIRRAPVPRWGWGVAPPWSP